MSDVSGLKKALEQERTKLQRRKDAVESSEAMVAMLEHQIAVEEKKSR